MIRMLDSVFGAVVAALAVLAATVIFLPLISSSPAVAAPHGPVILDIPGFVDGVNFTNPQAIMDCAGVVWAATRASSAMGGIVWRVDGYQDSAHRGVATQVNPTDPTLFFANGELAVWPDGYLYYISVQINNLQQREALAQFAVAVPGFAATNPHDGSCLTP